MSLSIELGKVFAPTVKPVRIKETRLARIAIVITKHQHVHPNVSTVLNTWNEYRKASTFNSRKWEMCQSLACAIATLVNLGHVSMDELMEQFNIDNDRLYNANGKVNELRFDRYDVWVQALLYLGKDVR